jgi:hypothetical protein
MGRPLIRCRGSAATLAVNFAFDQHHHAAGQQRNVPFLPGHDIGQILDRAGQVRDAFFKGGLIGHGVQEARAEGFCKGFLAPVPGAG